MNVGKLTQRIEIQIYGEIENDIGEITKGWSTYKNFGLTNRCLEIVIIMC